MKRVSAQLMHTLCGFLCLNTLHVQATIPQRAASSLNGKVWIDTNENGVFDRREHGLAKVKVRLTNENGVFVAETVSDEKGFYQFTKLRPSNYYLHFVAPKGYEPKRYQDAFSNITYENKVNTLGSSEVVVLKANDRFQDFDIPFQPSKISATTLNVYNCIWEDKNTNNVLDIGEQALEGVTVVLYNEKGKSLAQTTTDKNGMYGFWGIKKSQYSVAYYFPKIEDKQNQYAALYKISDQNEGLSAVQPAVNQFYVMPSNRYALLTWKINPDFHAQYVEVWRATESKDNFDEKVNTITVQQSLNDYYQEYDQDSHLFLYEKCYYRLKVINDKEEVQWSDIVEYDANVTHTPIQLNIYTDRTDEGMFINYQLDSDYKQAYLLISDAKGQKLYQSELAKNTISGQVNINISEWEQGTYQVKIMADGTAIQKSCFIP